MGEGDIYWRPATEAETESSQSGRRSNGTSDVGKVLTAIQSIGSIEKGALVAKRQNRGIGKHKAREIIETLVTEGKIQEISVPRHGTRPQIHLVGLPALTNPRCEPDSDVPTPPS